jgi:hypothetical protein
MTFRLWGAAAAAMLAALSPGDGHAASATNFIAKTTGDVATLCDPKSDSAMDNAGINFCEGFTLGVVLTQQQHQAAPNAKQFFCLPDPPPTRDEAMAGFVTWANAAPDRLTMPAVDGLISFLGERYPCPKHR